MNAVLPASMAIFARARAARDGFCRAAVNDRRQRIAASAVDAARPNDAHSNLDGHSRRHDARRFSVVDLSRARISYAQTVTHQNPPATARGTSANSESTPPRATPSSDARRRACRARARDATRRRRRSRPARPRARFASKRALDAMRKLRERCDDGRRAVRDALRGERGRAPRDARERDGDGDGDGGVRERGEGGADAIGRSEGGGGGRRTRGATRRRERRANSYLARREDEGRETNGTGAMDDAGGRSRDEINCGDAWSQRDRWSELEAREGEDEWKTDDEDAPRGARRRRAARKRRRRRAGARGRAAARTPRKV